MKRAVLRLVEAAGPSDELATLTAHLDRCAECRQLVRGARAVRAGDKDARSDRPATDERSYPPGTVIGRFVVLRRAGQGGMGSLAARDLSLDRDVAIKLLRPDFARDQPDAARRIVREARAMAMIAHPNVVAIHDVGTFEDQVFIAMELAGGGTLRRWLRDEPRGWREILQQFLYAGRGVQAAHDVGLVHRDFKPDNVLLMTDGRVRVADFVVGRTPRSNPRRTAGPTLPSRSRRSICRDAESRRDGDAATWRRNSATASGRADAVGLAFCVALTRRSDEHPFHAETVIEMLVKLARRSQSRPSNTAAKSVIARRVAARAAPKRPIAGRRWRRCSTRSRSTPRTRRPSRRRLRVEERRSATPPAARRSAGVRRRRSLGRRHSDAQRVCEDAQLIRLSAAPHEALFCLGTLREEGGDLPRRRARAGEAAVKPRAKRTIR
jgi:serine/threonine protein kinase